MTTEHGYALVIYESMFGHAQQIAEAVAVGLSGALQTRCVEVGAAPPAVPDDVGLLVVGGPNHAFTLSRAATRAEAARKTDQPLVSAGIGLRDWLDALPAPVETTYAATFDTRLTEPKMVVRMDHAAESSAKRLLKRGFHITVPSEHFHVSDVMGPLVEGDVARAEAWGSSLARRMTGNR